ncbi:MAG TPA: RNA methyltransferase [Opitutaceae bacterium]
MTPEKITSLQNPRIKQLVKLRDRRDRDEAGVFIVEGYREVLRALDAGAKPRELYVSRDWFLGENEGALIVRAAGSGAEVVELSKDAFAKVAYRDRPDGVLAVVPQWRTALDDLKVGLAARPPVVGRALRPKNVENRDEVVARADPFFLVVEAIEKPGNLGTILRSADAAGVDAVIVCDPVTDLFNPNVVRSSTGVLFSVPLAIASSETVREWLRARGVRAVATTPAATDLYTATDLTGPLAIVMGSEQYGLSDFWLHEADARVRIPMAGQADSLNVAMAAIITLFEAVRQRGK